eukprot:gb/GECH01005911.1/.p1 GENE.gb/GECH01005911.1/~~gb/GECH01005911.1/.p1  ORF type:complete len:367 (+),score=89.72 gb/GECH01005911.1/:1-1101(+)
MKALVLVGGFGTRLRPLTLSMPKPLVPLANLPMIEHQIRALRDAGVTEVILAVNYQPDAMREALAEVEQRYNVKVSFSQETEPLGTAGPLALARRTLAADDTQEPFFVLNSDIICEFPLRRLAQFHRDHGRQGTIVVTKVTDPSKYGVVVTEEDGRILRFVEKPQTYVGNRINAGLYIFQPDMLDRIELRPTSIEKEIFPQMADEGHLYAMDLPGFWMDVGQPKDFISGTGMYLESISRLRPQELHQPSSNADYKVIGNAVVDKTASIGKGSVIGPNVSIGPNCKVGEGVRLRDTCLMKGAVVGSHSWVSKSIIGWNSSLGSWVRMENVSVLGENVSINSELYINGGKILPHKGIKDNVPEPQIIM